MIEIITTAIWAVTIIFLTFVFLAMYHRYRMLKTDNRLTMVKEANEVMRELNKEAEQILNRVHDYPRQLRDIFSKAFPLRAELACKTEMVEQAMENDDEEEMDALKSRCCVLMEQLEALTRDGFEIQEKWDMDNERFREITQQVDEISKEISL